MPTKEAPQTAQPAPRPSAPAERPPFPENRRVQEGTVQTGKK
jgi:hypothetical protein